MNRSVASERASEPRERSTPTKRRARERVGESEGRSPSVRLELLFGRRWVGHGIVSHGRDGQLASIEVHDQFQTAHVTTIE